MQKKYIIQGGTLPAPIETQCLATAERIAWEHGAGIRHPGENEFARMRSI